MTITDRYDLHDIVLELEAALQIDGADLQNADIDELLRNVRKRISRQEQIDLISYNIDSPEMELSEFRESVSLFVDNVSRIHSRLAGYAQICRFLCRKDVSLSDVRYLGFTEDTLKTAIIALTRKDLLPKSRDSVKAIKDKLNTVGYCWEKRLFVLAIVASELGFHEITAAIAEILRQSLI